MAIQTVAVVGASGNVGTPITKALVAAGFKVTAITRESSTSTFPEGIEVRRADLTSVESLTKAFAGQDAVVVTTASAVVGEQHPIVDAAVAAGVRRFLPSEFGHRADKIKHAAFAQLIVGKAETLAYLKKQSKLHPEFTWTAISTEPFFDWGLDAGFFGIDLKSKTVKLFDSGNTTVGSSRLSFVGDSVVAALRREEETANKFFELAEFILSQNELIKIFEEETGIKFEVINVKTADLDKAGHAALAEGNYGGAFVPFLLAYNWGDVENHGVRKEQLANESLGLKGVNETSLREAVREYLKTRGL